MKTVILTLSFAFGFILIGYEDHARMRGWPVGAWLSGDAPFLKILAAFVCLGALAMALFVTPWWTVFIVAIGGFFIGFLLSSVLKWHVQWVAIIGVVICWALQYLYVLP